MPTQALSLPRQQRSRLEAAPPVEFMPDWQDEAASRDCRLARLRAGVLRAHEELAEIEGAIKASGQTGLAS